MLIKLLDLFKSCVTEDFRQRLTVEDALENDLMKEMKVDGQYGVILKSFVHKNRREIRLAQQAVRS